MAQVIFFEGPNYCGKTTTIQSTKKELEKKGKKVATLKDPGADFESSKIRSLLLDPETDFEYLTRRFLYAASFVHTMEAIKTETLTSDVVLVDRFNPVSDLMYGPMESNNLRKSVLQSEKILRVMRDEVEEVAQDAYLIVLDVSTQELMRRSQERATKENKLYDYKNDAFKIRIHQHYQSVFSTKLGKEQYQQTFFPFQEDNIAVIDANQHPDTVSENIATLILERSGEREKKKAVDGRRPELS